jgi:hypothetical protein
MQSLDRRRAGPGIISPQHARELGLSKLGTRLACPEPYRSHRQLHQRQRERGRHTNEPRSPLRIGHRQSERKKRADNSQSFHLVSSLYLPAIHWKDKHSSTHEAIYTHHCQTSRHHDGPSDRSPTLSTDLHVCRDRPSQTGTEPARTA